MKVDPKIRAIQIKIASTPSNVAMRVRARYAYRRLEQYQPNALKGYSFEQFYGYITSFRQAHNLSKSNHRAKMKRALRSKRLVNFVEASFENILLFLQTHRETLAKYERMKASMPHGLRITFNDDYEPTIELKE